MIATKEPPREAAVRMKKNERKGIMTGLLFVSPWLIGFLIFTLYPVFASAYLSFTDYRVLAPPKWVGLSNYTDLFHDHDYFLPSLMNTIFMFLELPLAAPSWKLRFGLANDYNSKPGAGFKNLDTAYFTRLVLNWK